VLWEDYRILPFNDPERQQDAIDAADDGTAIGK
jgi:hypothetical protein